MSSKINIVVRLQHWMDSVPGQTFLNYAYSWGASIVILGALFKLTHIPGSNFMLFVGMGTEVVVFFLSAFDRPFDKTEIGKELPAHHALDRKAQPRTHLFASAEDHRGNRRCKNAHDPPQHRPRRALTARRFGKHLAQHTLQCADRLSDQHDRVRQAVRVAQKAVDPKAGKKRQQQSDHTLPPACMVNTYTGFCPVIN